MLKEVELRASDGVPDHPVHRSVMEADRLTSRTEMVWLGECSAAVHSVRGPPEALDGLASEVERGPWRPNGREARTIDRTPHKLTWYEARDRPEEAPLASLEHLVFDATGAQGRVSYRVRPGALDLRLLSPCPSRLGSASSELEDALAQRFAVETVYAGELRPPDGAGYTPTPEDSSLLALVEEEGYYEYPRQTSLNDLADALEVSKSTLCERLRKLEREAVREILSSLGPATAVDGDAAPALPGRPPIERALP